MTSSALRATGGKRRIAKARGAMAWCANVAETTTVWREGHSRVAVLAAPCGARRRAARRARVRGGRRGSRRARAHVAARRGSRVGRGVRCCARAGCRDITTAELPVEPGTANARVVGARARSGRAHRRRNRRVVVACDPGIGRRRVSARRSVRERGPRLVVASRRRPCRHGPALRCPSGSRCSSRTTSPTPSRASPSCSLSRGASHATASSRRCSRE